ncbi:metallophosphoesterase [Phosphitispora sp. TUW77]|uniref:metallophosphoesterase n=1 Tax=Phosphitispora sp. TUW77 TaxID=3152361 RepID=UPI003AB908B6
MKSIIFIFVAAIIIFIYGAINYYIGYRGWHSLAVSISFLNRKVYWVVFWLVVSAYPAAQILERFLPAVISRWITITGAYWIAAMFYFLLIIMLIDFIRLVDRFFGILPEAIKVNPLTPLTTGGVVLALVTGILVYGTFNALNPEITRYDLVIDKKPDSVKKLDIIMVSDIHLGSIVRTNRLQKLVEEAYRLNPDLILFSGDIVDQSMEPTEVDNMVNVFGNMQARFGKFAVPGNHEYISGHADDAFAYLEQAGFRVLRDEYVKVADSFYVVGRDNTSHQGPRTVRRQLSELMEEVDRSLPVILLDHEPNDLANARENGVDLQLSGHTHRGQLFPNHLITGWMYEGLGSVAERTPEPNSLVRIRNLGSTHSGRK